MNATYEEKAVLPTVEPCLKPNPYEENVHNPRDIVKKNHLNEKELRYLGDVVNPTSGNLCNILTLPNTTTALVPLEPGIAES